MEKLIGKIEYQTFAEGSKSESQRPFLATENGEKILLYKKNDNPFENTVFSDFEGKNVIVEGEIKENTFVVYEIRHNDEESSVAVENIDESLEETK